MTSIVIPSYTLNYDKNGLNIRGKNGNNIKANILTDAKAAAEILCIFRIL